MWMILHQHHKLFLMTGTKIRQHGSVSNRLSSCLVLFKPLCHISLGLSQCLHNMQELLQSVQPVIQSFDLFHVCVLKGFCWINRQNNEQCLVLIMVKIFTLLAFSSCFFFVTRSSSQMSKRHQTACELKVEQ